MEPDAVKQAFYTSTQKILLEWLWADWWRSTHV
jgi:hypothetical protein